MPLVLFAVMQPAPANKNEQRLFTDLRSNGKIVVHVLNALSASYADDTVISVEAKSFETRSPCLLKCFDLRSKDLYCSALLQDATVHNQMVVAADLTFRPNSYRPVAPRAVQLDYEFPNGPLKSASNGMQFWVEQGVAKAKPGLVLFATITRDGSNKPSVKCSSVVERLESGGYRYVYTISNETDEELSYKWAGLEGKIPPKITLTHSFNGDKLTTEQRSTLELQSPNSPAKLVIPANVWEKP
jgi:hypothetical protein